MEYRKPRFEFRKIVLFLIILMILWFVVHSIVIVADGLNDNLNETDVGVVLGNKVELDGQPSDRLRARLDKAIDLYLENYISHVIVSGGVGKEGFDEAEVMKNYLVNEGIPTENITTDSDGYNTLMTAENANKIMYQLELDTVTVITQYHHITRSKLAFEKQGFETVYGAHAEIFQMRDFYSIFREFFAFYKYLFY
ncbi:YdcF family protein [Aquibacillus rhizosphaerae]|uniref:YdcF family protein n=1 Tax=Aquibacillus rhizosphaerae TaxID=3051431 RepID=A0ABT7LCU4_9BACI|nr:YdcF family protein [Aquibacillus sp. LR5S19]MDL4843082.1 YdcF family protein [Aquibacillus sp. LR5S19]